MRNNCLWIVRPFYENIICCKRAALVSVDKDVAKAKILSEHRKNRFVNLIDIMNGFFV